jgi:hypothetical protein
MTPGAAKRRSSAGQGCARNSNVARMTFVSSLPTPLLETLELPYYYSVSFGFALGSGEIMPNFDPITVRAIDNQNNKLFEYSVPFRFEITAREALENAFALGQRTPPKPSLIPLSLPWNIMATANRGKCRAIWAMKSKALGAKASASFRILQLSTGSF